MVYSIELGYDPEEWEECPDDEYFMLFGFFTRMFLSLVAVGTTALLFWFIEARKQWAKLAKDTTETQQPPIYIQTMTTKGPEQTILRVKEGLTAKDVSLPKGEQYQQRDESTFSKEEQEALEEWRREVARLEEDRLRQLDDHFSGESDRLSEIETESQLIDALLPTDEISYDSQGTDVDQYDYLKDIGATPTCTPQNSADATGENIHLDEVNIRLGEHDQNLVRTPEHLTRPSESERVKMEAVSVPAAGNGLDDWVTTPSATDMLEKETSEAMASPPEESPLKESAAPIQPRSVEPQQMRISSDSENGFVKVYEEKDTTTTSDSIILIPRSAVIMSATDGVPESEHIYDIPTVDQRDQRQFAGWSLQQPTATSEQPKAEIIIDDSRKVIVPEEEKVTEREQKLEDITKDQQQQQQQQQEPYSRIPLEPTVIDGGPPAQFDARTTAAPASVQYQKTDTELALGQQPPADSQPQILAEREPQKPATQTPVEPPESVVAGESVTEKVVEEYRYDSGKPDERVSGEQPAEGGSDFMKPVASSVYATIPSVLAQQPAAASTTTVETTVKLQPHIPSGEHAPLQAESVQTQEFISQETMGNLEPKKLIEETIGTKGDHYAEEPNKVKDLEGLAKKEAEELQKLFEEYQIIAEKPAEPPSYSKPMPVAEYAELHQTQQEQIKTIPPEHPPFPSASFEHESPLKGTAYQPEQVPVPQQQQAEELPSQPIQSSNLATERDQSDQRRVRSDRPGRILGIRVEKPEYEEAKVKRFVETVQTPEEFEYSRSHPVRVSEHVGAKMSERDQQRSKDEALERQRDQQETAAATAAIELASDEMKRLAEVDIYVQDAMDYVSAQRQEQDEMYRAQYPLPEGQQAAQAGSRMDTISGFVIEEEMLESVGRSGGHQLPLSGLQKQAQQLQQKKPEDGHVHEHERKDGHEHEPEHGRDRDREKAREVDREYDRKEEREHLKATFSNEQISGEATSELVHTNEEFEKIEHIAELDDTMTYAPEIQSIEIPPDRSSENSENLQEYFDQVAAECMVGVFKQPQKPGRFPTEAPSAIPTQKLTDMTPSISSAKSYTSSEGERLQKQSSLLSAVGATNMQEMLLALTSLEELSVAMAKAGLESTNLIFGIDYTASNKYQGEQCFGGRSLHSIDPFIPNPYQQVISVMGRTLAPFATSGFIPAYGFGDAKTGDRSVFKLKDDGECRNLDEVLRVYNKVTPTVSLSGPTNFAPVIYQAIEICEAVQDYHILVIVADGQVTNEKATRKAIVRACQYPLSIIVVGVGDGPWDMMRVFDDSLPKRPWDNFHFVEFHDVMRKAKGIQSGELSFAIQSLLEIPDQYGIVKQLGLVRGSKLHSKAK